MQETTFHSLWDSNQQQLKSFVLSSVKTKAATDDILQESYLQGYMHFSTLVEKEKFTAWIYRITRNYIYRYFNEKKKFAPVSDEIFEKESELPTFLQENKNIQHLAAQCGAKIGNYQHLLHHDINTIYAELVSQMADFQNISIDYIEAWVECDVKQTPQKIFAERKGIGLSAAKSRVQRAREKIKNILMNCCLFEFDVRGAVVNYTPIDTEKKCLLTTDSETCNV